jgi:hypothetical protein
LRLPFLDARQRDVEDAELSSDIRVDLALAAGVRRPVVRLDAVGAVVVASYIPEGPGFPRPTRG